MNAADPPAGERTGPLAGLRILDLASVIMGPVAAQHLADMGADVIKVESPDGDLTRALGPRRHDRMGAVFLTCNRNKRSLVLDLKHPGAQAVLHRLVAGSDALVHSVRSGPAQAIGLSWPALRAVNPRLVYCHVKGYADDGAYAGQPAFDDTIQAASGLAHLQTAVAGAPRYVPSSVVDKICAIHAAWAILLALFHRERTGEGQEVTLPMFETMAAFNTTEHLWGEVFRPAAGPMGYESVRKGIRKPYPTKDGFLAFLPYSDEHWQRFFALIDRPDLARDPRYATFDARQRHADDVFALTAELLRERTTAEWVALLGDADMPMSAVNRIEDLLEHPHLKSVGFWQDVEHPTEGPLRMARNPVGLTASPPSIRRLAPRLGEHTREVLREFALDDAQIGRLLADGVVREAAP